MGQLAAKLQAVKVGNSTKNPAPGPTQTNIFYRQTEDSGFMFYNLRLRMTDLKSLQIKYSRGKNGKYP